MKSDKVLVHNEVNNRKQGGRDTGIDMLKFLCTFMVICIHCQFPGRVGQGFTALCRSAVPVFFMITGFFYQTNSNVESDKRRIKKILVLVIEANVLFLLWDCFKAIVLGEGLHQYLSSVLSIKSVLKFLLLNESTFGIHLWYLGAILYVLIIVAIAKKLKLLKLLYVLTPVLLIVDLVFGKYSLLLLHREFPYVLVRNFLFVGIPYFCIGTLLRRYELKIKAPVLITLTILFCTTTILEQEMLLRFDLSATREHYLSTTFLAFTLFLLYKNIFKDGKENHVKHIMSKIGREYSTGIYIIHPIFIMILSFLASRIGVATMYQLVGPIVVYIASIVFMIIWNCLCKKNLPLLSKH